MKRSVLTIEGKLVREIVFLAIIGMVLGCAALCLSEPNTAENIGGGVLTLSTVYFATKHYRSNLKGDVMKKMFGGLSLLVLVVMMSGCGKTIEPGYTGIKINQMGSDKGVSKENLVTGFQFYMPMLTKIVSYPTFNTRAVWTASAHEGKEPINEELSFQTRDSVPVTMDAAINYQLAPSKVPEFYTQFRADKIDMFTHGFLRDVTRNALSNIASEYAFDDINGAKKEEFFAKVAKSINDAVGPYGVAVKQFSSIGALRPPANLVNAINSKVQATQDAIKSENDLRKFKADAAKAVAQAEGEAASNRAVTSSLSPALMELKRLEIDRIRAQKWDGKMPSTMLGSGSGTLLNIGK